jgi:hypothetical protein
LNRLPVPQWLHRFEAGTLRISGRLTAPVTVGIGEFGLAVPAGLVRISVVFQGGPSAFVSTLQVAADGLVWRDADRSVEGEVWCWKDGIAVMDEAPVGRIDGRKSQAVETLVQHLSDVHVEARAVPAKALTMRSGRGFEVSVPAGVVMTAVGCTRGGPKGLVLARPMVVGFAGEGIALALSRFRRVSAMLSVRVVRLTLHPNGRVELEGRGTRGLGRAVRRGLSTTAEVLSEWVREGTATAMIRPFLVLS